MLVKYHWKTQQGVESMTAAQAAEVQALDLGHASKDLYEAIERGDFPRWELNVQIMSDDEHPELDFDPLDDTKVWPEDQFPPRPVGMRRRVRPQGGRGHRPRLRGHQGVGGRAAQNGMRAPLYRNVAE